MDYNRLNGLLEKTKAAYDLSDIKRYCDREGHKWFYSLFATKVTENMPLIVGFNWGAAHGVSYAPQLNCSHESFSNLYKEKRLGSLARIIPYLHKYMPGVSYTEMGQSNYCFFRSHQECQITEHDLELCKPIFIELLEIVKPSLLLCFSVRLRNYLLLSDRIQNIATAKLSGRQGSSENNCVVIKGEIAHGRVKIYFLPHPNYPLRRELREKAWEFCFMHNY